ncbi:hypothetical protein J3A72_000475 [Stenotrophomonas sp. PvP093]|uniref:hypothetical protein n=1 Tax=unclassified Stenotrophomonas TaxID=196198 RepID=UPI001AE98816|nr:hypothetical protein [Stenotrophomonas sp. PvP093]MBP2480183.1 hypothetical protein [Stenotrophomonas sp. PvP093]
MTFTYHADGDANHYTLIEGGRWIAAVKLNGEMLAEKQERIMQCFADTLGGTAFQLSNPLHLAAVLAGLRLLQNSDTLPPDIDAILTDSGLLPRICDTDIDALCERLTCAAGEE